MDFYVYVFLIEEEKRRGRRRESWEVWLKRNESWESLVKEKERKERVMLFIIFSWICWI